MRPTRRPRGRRSESSARRTFAEALERRTMLSVTGQLVTPANNGVTNVDRGYVDVAWVDSTGTGLRANTLDHRDILIANVNVQAPTQVSPGVWRYPYAGNLTPGNVYVSFVEGQVKNQANESNAFGSASFRYDTSGPNVYNQWPGVPSAYAGDLTRIAIMFNEPLDPATFNLADDVKLLGPDGAEVAGAVKSFEWHGTYNDYMSVYVVPPNVGGTHELVVGPNITDAAGNPMDQDKDGAKGEAGQDAFVHPFEVEPLVTFYEENLDANPGWATAAGGQWQFGTPTGGGGASHGNPDPTAGHTGGNVYGINLAGDYDVDNWTTDTLTSTAIDASRYEHMKLGFWRWLNSDVGNRVDQNVYFSIDNRTWYWLWSSDDAAPTTDAGWQHVEYLLPPMADQQATLYLRFAHRTASGAALPYAGWNIDDITLRGAAVDVSAPVGAPDLLPASDTGISDSDDLTRLNNKYNDPSMKLSFRVPGATPGARVIVYADGVAVGHADATGGDTVVTTYANAQLSEGAHVFTARQSEPGLDLSAPSPGLTVTIDSVAPQITVSPRQTADLTPAVYGPTPTGSAVKVTATVNGVAYDATINSAQWFVPDGAIGPLNAGLYDVQATATDAAGNVGSDNTLDELKIQPLPPVIITEPAATAGTSNTITWQPVAGATHYWVEYDTSLSFASPDGNSGWIPATSTSHTFDGLSDGVTYYFRVKPAGFTSGRTGAWSQTTSPQFQTGTLSNANAKTLGSVTLDRAAVLFADDFEDGDDAGWIETQNTYGNYVQTTPAPAPGAGAYALSLWGNAGTYYHPLPALRPARVDFNVLAPQVGYVGYFVLEGATDLNRAIFFYMQTDGTMGVFDGTNTMHTTPYEPNRWYNVSFLIDWNAKRFTCLVDGQTIATAVPFREDADSFQTVRLYNHIGSFDPKAHYDEISLTSSATRVFQSAGSVTSSLVAPQQLSSWSTLDFTKTTPAGTAVTVDVLNSSGDVLAANVPAGANLAALGVTAPSIRLRANLSTTDPAVTPSLDGWSVGWKTSPDLYVEGGWSGITYSRQDDTPPTMTFPMNYDPTQSSWNWFPIEFSEPVSGLKLADFTLTRDGGPNLLTSANTVVSLNGTSWRIENTWDLANRAGSYVLTYAPHDVKDAAGNAAVAGRSIDWLKNRVSGISSYYDLDTITLRRSATDPSLVEITHNGDAYTVDLAGFADYGDTPLEISGYQGDDAITVDFSNGAPAPAGGLFVSGGNDEGSLNRLVIKGTAGDDAVEYLNDSAIGPRFRVAGAGAGAGGGAVTVRFESFYRRRFDGGAGNDSLTMRSGFTFVEDFGTATENLTLNVDNGARVLFAASQRLAALNVNNGLAEVNYHGRHVLRTGALAVADAGVLEMQDNDLMVDYATGGASALGGWDGQKYGGVLGLIAAGRIRSATALASDGLTTLAAAEAADALGLAPGATATWQGYAVDATTVLVKYTYGGDTNFDGKLDADDYGTIDFNVLVPGSSGYYQGDFNLDGKIDADDYGVIDFNILAQGTPL